MAKENGTSLTRRTFLRSTALAVGGMAAAGTLGCSSVSTKGETSVEPDEAQIFNGHCRGNCGGYCNLEGVVREGKLVSTMPRTYDREHEGVTNGCIRGIASPLRVYSEHRVLHPMLQTGERGSDNWEEISWDEALKLIAEKFQKAIDTDGPRSVGAWTGAGNPSGILNGAGFHIANWESGMGGASIGVGRFMQKIGMTHFGSGGDQAGMYMRFFMLGVPISAAEDLQHSGTIVAWGSNPAAATIGKRDWYWICKARENGAKIITIDPLYTETASKSDIWAPVRMGSDGALMLALVNHLVETGRANEDYLKNKSVSPFLIKEDGSYLRASEVGLPASKDGNDENVVWDTAVDTFTVVSAAADPALLGTFDVNGVSARTVYDASLENIASFTVDFAAEECGLARDTILEIADIISDNGPTCLCIDWGIEHTHNCFRLYYAASLLASVLGDVGKPGGGYCTPNNMGSQWKKMPVTTSIEALTVNDAKEVPVITGDWMVEMFEEGKWNGEPYPVNALYIMTHDPLDNGCDPNAMLKTWENIDFIVTADSAMTTTAHYSDLVLPVASSWEAEDWYGNSGMLQKAIEPLGEAKTDIDIFRGIADAMGLTDLYPLTNEEYLRSYLDTPENLEANLGYDAYHEKGCIDSEYTYTEYPATEYMNGGRTTYYLEQFISRDIILDYASPREDCMPGYTHTIEAYKDNPERTTYPLFGFSSHSNFHGQSMFADNAWLDEFRKLNGLPYCLIHEKAAAERDIKTGDIVRAFSKYGECILAAQITKGIHEECVWFPHGFCWDEFIKGTAQSLTGHLPDIQTCNANYNDFILQVEKYEGGAQ